MSSITASEMKYLLTIEEIGQNVKMVAIAKKLGITKASVFHSIERLEKKNLVKKECLNPCKTNFATERSGRLLLETESIIPEFAGLSRGN